MKSFAFFTVRGPPVAWARARKHGKTHFKAPKPRAHETYIAWQAKRAMNGAPPVKGPVHVTVQAVVPIPSSWSATKKLAAVGQALLPISRPDVDHYAKLAMDAMNKLVYADDAQVVRLTIDKVYGLEPRTTITVTEL